jgi:hypothetical protein
MIEVCRKEKEEQDEKLLRTWLPVDRSVVDENEHIFTAMLFYDTLSSPSTVFYLLVAITSHAYKRKMDACMAELSATSEDSPADVRRFS